MATSLADQLKRLAIPKALQQKESKKRASLLFDADEAANLDRDVLYEIGASGFKELVALDPTFRKFEKNLFAKSTIHMNRAVESSQVNQKFDRHINNFLKLVSPYLLLKQSQKALEWLVARFYIHEFNVDDFMALILPYHETNIFVKALQLVDLKLASNKQWAWLESLQRKGLHLPRSLIVNHAISDSSFLRFICDRTIKIFKKNKKYEREQKLGTLITFYCTTLLGVISRGEMDEHKLSVILPSFLECLRSKSVDMKASGFMIAGQLLANNQLGELLMEEIMNVILTDEEKMLPKDMALLMVLICQTQKPPPIIQPQYFSKLDWLREHLIKLSADGVLVGPLIVHLVKCCLEHVIDNGDHLVDAQTLAWKLSSEISITGYYVKELIRLIDVKYVVLFELLRLKKSKIKRDPNLLKWFNTYMLTMLEAHYAIIQKEEDDTAFLSVLKKWKCPDSFVDDEEIERMLKECTGDKQEKTWPKLRPLLLKKIGDKKIFQALCKVAPSYDNLVLLLILEKLLLISRLPTLNRQAILARIFKSNFALANPHLKDISNALSSGISESVEEVIEIRLIKNQKENPIEFEAWLAAIKELQEMKTFLDSNPIWQLSLDVLAVSLPSQFSAGHALQLINILSSMKRKKMKNRFEILKTVINYMKSERKESKWFSLADPDPNVWLKVKMLEYIIIGLSEDTKFESNYKKLFVEFTEKCSKKEFVRLICAVCCGYTNKSTNADASCFEVGHNSQLHTLKLAMTELGNKKGNFYDSFKSEINQVMSYLLCTLRNPSSEVRAAGLQVVEALVEFLEAHGDAFEVVLLKQLLNRSEEISLDPDQLNVAMYCALSPSDTVQATLEKTAVEPLKRCRGLLLRTIMDEETPLHVTLQLLELLDGVNSCGIMENLVQLGHRAIADEKDSLMSKSIIMNFWKRLNESTAKVLESEQVWSLAEKCMRHKKCDDLCPAVTFLKSITREVFGNLSKPRQQQLLQLMIATRSQTDSINVSAAVASVVKKIYLESDIVAPLIKQMTSPFASATKRRDTVTIVEAKEWKEGVSLLELIQSKKKLVKSHLLLDPLFAALKFCLDQDEQTAFEFVKQLLLGCLLFCCQKLPPEDGSTFDESVLNIELAVNCLRASSNPQTHHHALLLLSCFASLLPNQVMHNIMAIFTFMGTSVARLDDEHSVKVVTQVVDTVVPVLVETMSKRIMEESDVNDSDAIVAEVLRVFVWALRDIPQHRRNPLFIQLLDTLGPERSVWIFLVLLFENYVLQGDTSKSEWLSMPPSLYLGLQLTLAKTPEIILQSLNKIVNYLIDLPIELMNPEKNPNKTYPKASRGLFDFQNHTPKELRHFAYTILTFLNSLLTDHNLIVQVTEMNNKDPDSLTPIFKEILSSLLKYVPIVTRQYDKQPNKYWKAMVHQSNDVLDKLVALASNEMLVQITRRLLNHAMGPLRRKAVELLNVSLQSRREEFNPRERESLRMLIEPLMDIVRTIGEECDQETELLQQTVLISIKFLGKLLAADDTAVFVKILSELCGKCKKCSGHVLGSVVLTIAELVACLKAHSVSELPVLMPLVLKVSSKYLTEDTVDLGLISAYVALNRIVDVLPNFLSPYLDKLLFTVSLASVKWTDNVELSKKLGQIRQKLAKNVPHRVLIPAVQKSYNKLVSNRNYDAVGPLFNILADTYNSAQDFGKLVTDLTHFFISAFQFRSDCVVESRDVTPEEIYKVESAALEAFVPLVLKLSESSFKPVYYQLFHWSSEQKDRYITFYRLSQSLAASLKGLFVLFAGHFFQNAATLLDATNITKAEKGYFGDTKEGEAKTVLLLENILKTLHLVFFFDSVDSSNFLNKNKFEVLLHPLVDQLDNTLGGTESLEKRTKEILTPCLAEMASAIDDTLWKSLNYEVLLKSKSNLSQVRIAAIETIVAMATKLGEQYMMLLPETIGYLAELLEDEDEKVENAMKSAIQRLEDVLGQPIREYFQ